MLRYLSFSASSRVGGIFGTFVGGHLVDFLGDKKMLNIYLAVTTILMIVFSFIPDLWPYDQIIFAFILFYYLFSTLLVIGLCATSIKLSLKGIAASKFTLFVVLSDVGIAAGFGLVGNQKKSMCWDYVLLLHHYFQYPFKRKINFKKNELAIAKLKMDYCL